MKYSLFFAVLLLGVLSAGAHRSVAQGNEFKKFTGTWSCPTCDASRLEGKYVECEALGHKHALKLDGGQYIDFLPNERSESLITGGGRHRTRVEIYGFYSEATNTLDVECYQIDGLWTTWCNVHQRMDMCRSGAEHQALSVSEKAGK